MRKQKNEILDKHCSAWYKGFMKMCLKIQMGTSNTSSVLLSPWGKEICGACVGVDTDCGLIINVE